LSEARPDGRVGWCLGANDYLRYAGESAVRRAGGYLLRRMSAGGDQLHGERILVRQTPYEIKVR